MSRQEVIDHIGTIAKSGTREFFEPAHGRPASDAQLIGQFGVGFYSAFIVADRVTLRDATGRARADTACDGRAPGEGDYTIETRAEGARAAPMSSCICVAGEDELLVGHEAARDSAQVLGSHHVPILMKKEQWDAQGQATSTGEDEQVNQASALWARPKSEITDEQYQEFYKHVAPRLRAAARLDAREGRGPPGVHAALLHTCQPRALRSVGPRTSPRHQALRPPRVHHGRRRAAAAGLPALRARHRRLERSAAERLARDPAAVARRRRRFAPRPSSACSACSRIWRPKQPEKYATFWTEFGRVLKEGVVEDAHESRADREAAAICVDPRRRATARRCRWPTTSAA